MANGRTRRILGAGLLILLVGGAAAWKLNDLFAVSEPTAEEKATAQAKGALAAVDKPASFVFFSDEWAKEWGKKLNASQVYKDASKGWKWKTALVRTADASVGFPDEGAVYLDLWEGDCRDSRLAKPGDVEQCEYVLVATPRVWKEIVAGERSIHPALISGEVKLRKGSLLTLLRFIKAANEMVALSTRINTEFPPKLLDATAKKSPAVKSDAKTAPPDDKAKDGSPRKP